MPHYEEYYKKGGFTLLESIIAAGLLAAVMTVFLSIWVMVAAGARAERLIVAHHIASTRIDELRQTAFEALPSSGPFSNPMLAELPGGSAQLTITNYRDSTEMRQVQVMVSWLEAGAARTYALDTVIARGATHAPQ